MNYSKIFTEKEYQILAGPDWPSYHDFCAGVQAQNSEIQKEINLFIDEKCRYEPTHLLTTNKALENFLVLDSCHGRFIINRHDQYQPVALVKTGKTHIEHELKNIFEILNNLGRDIVVVDGGANAGFFSVPVSKHIQPLGGRVIAFEPQRVMYYALCGTLALNDIDNCWPHNVALGAVEQEIIMPAISYDKFSDFGLISLRLQPTANQQESELCRQITTKMCTLDQFQLNKLDFIKLDVEGYECKILQGAKKTIEQHRPWMWIEYYIIGVENIKKYLPANYYCQVVDQFNMVCAPEEKFNTIKLSFINE